jgi:FtsH-binding integral membrane protein
MSTDPRLFSFVTAHYRVLQGWTYAPFGVALLGLSLGVALAEAFTTASLAESPWFVVGAIPAAIVLGLPFAIRARRYYHRTFGRVEPDPNRMESPPKGFVTFLLFAGAIVLFGGVYVFIAFSDLLPDYLTFPWVLSGWLGAALLGQWNFQRSLRSGYPLVALIVAGVTALPLLGVDMATHLIVHYSVLGAAIWGVGWNEHRLLTQLMPGAPAEVSHE